MASRTIYIGLFMYAEDYTRGILDVINLINTQFPNNTLIITQYVVTGDPNNIKSNVDSFLTSYPSGDRVTISTNTTVITEITTYLTTLEISMPNFSLSATSISIKSLNNALTYAYYDQYSVMSDFMIIKDFDMKYVKILYDANTTDDLFIQSYITLLETQANLLNIPISKKILTVDGHYHIHKKSAIFLLCRTENLVNKYVTPKFLKSIPSYCYFSLTDLNDDCGDIFGDIPAFVMDLTALNYTQTSHQVFASVSNPSLISYTIYPFYDILYTLNFYTSITIPLTLSNYVNVNPFTTQTAAWSNALSFNTDINGSNYGCYDAKFTKDVLVNKYKKLFEKYNSLEFILPQSWSLFRTVGIAPFFRTETYYCEQNFYKIYKNCKLKMVRFDKNSTDYKDLVVNTSEIVENKFLLEYNSDRFFTKLIKIANPKDGKMVVNQTMSKKPIKLFIQK